MGILSNQDIVKRIRSRELVIDPFDPGSVGPDSVDLHLGQIYVTLERRGLIEYIDLASLDGVGGDEFLRTKLQLLREKDFQSEFYIHPGRVVVAYVKEYIELPLDLAARVDGRSKFAQVGLQVESAGLVHAGWVGHLVLELSNLGEVPIKVSGGIAVCQISFYPLTSPVLSPGELLALWKGGDNG